MVDGDALLGVLNETADAIAAALGSLTDWGPSGGKIGQYLSDLAADTAGLEVLDRAGLGVLSEESGRHDPDREVTVVIDPLDGSTNAARGIPWFATSLCAVDARGPVAAVVVNLISSERFEAVRGAGATCNGVELTPSGSERLDDSIIALSGFPPRHLGWRQFRSLGAVALDLCAVASGVLDGFVDCSVDAHGSWDYMGALLVCSEAGATVVDALGRDLVVLEHGERRTPVAGATRALVDELVAARADAMSRTTLSTSSGA